MSSRDFESSFPEHIADSLTLVPYVGREISAGKVYVDIGTGGGLPAIPISIIHQAAPSILVERNQRKATFLRKVCATLSLHHVKILCTSFPDHLSLPHPFALTARAIEKPEIFIDALAAAMKPGSLFLRQTGLSASPVPRCLRTQRITDQFDAEGLRRGLLFSVFKI